MSRTRGTGGVRRLEAKDLRLQEKVREKEALMLPVKGDDNPADLGTN